MNPKDIQKAINAYVSDLSDAQMDDLYRSLNGKKGRSNKRLIIVIVAIFLALSIGCAYAITYWRALVESTVSEETQKGSYETWDVSQKLDFISSLSSFGIDIDVPSIDGMSETEANRLLTKNLEDTFGGETSLLTQNMMHKQKGRFDSWSLEDKAWYTQLIYQYGLLNQGALVHFMPEEDDIPLVEVENLARAAVSSEHLLSEEELLGYTAYFSYCANQDNLNHKFWVVNFRDATDRLFFSTRLDANGALLKTERFYPAGLMSLEESEGDLSIKQVFDLQQKMESELGPMYKWSLEDKAKVFPKVYGIPNAKELQLEDVLRIAMEEMQRVCKWTDEITSMHESYAYFLIDNPEHYYTVNFFLDDELVGSVHINALSGAIIKTSTVRDGNG